MLKFASLFCFVRLPSLLPYNCATLGGRVRLPGASSPFVGAVCLRSLFNVILRAYFNRGNRYNEKESVVSMLSMLKSVRLCVLQSVLTLFDFNRRTNPSFYVDDLRRKYSVAQLSYGCVLFLSGV